jgi:hypothetical protein
MRYCDLKNLTKSNIYSILSNNGEEEFCKSFINNNLDDIIDDIYNNSQISSELLLFLSQRENIEEDNIDRIISKYNKKLDKESRKNLSLAIYYNCENIKRNKKKELLSLIFNENEKSIYYNLLISFWASDIDVPIVDQEFFNKFYNKYSSLSSNLPSEMYQLLPVVDIIYKSVEKNKDLVSREIVEEFIQNEATREYGLDMAYYLSETNAKEIPSLEDDICKAYKEIDNTDHIIKKILSNSDNKKMNNLVKLYVSEKISDS